MSNSLFKRRCRITAWAPQATTTFVGRNPQFFTPQPNGIVIENLRVQFKIDKSLEKTPNEAEVTITNCSANTRAFLQQKPLTVQIEAGYDDDLRFVFTGDVRYASSTVNEADWETKLQLGEGDRAYRYARVSRTFTKGANIVTALREVASTMGLVVPGDVAASSDLQAQFATGRTLHGPARDELSKLLSPFGYHWSIQAGQLQIVKDQSAAPGTAFLLAQSTGLIKSPEYTTPEKAGKPAALKTESLLFPALIPGVTINVESLQVSGFFRINKLTHTADTHGEDWTTQCESLPLAGVKAA